MFAYDASEAKNQRKSSRKTGKRRENVAEI